MNSMRVALVEDNAIFCFLFKKFLEDYPSRKIEVQIFSDGKKAWDHFESIKGSKNLFPDMLFIDINMPLMNGWQLIENLVVNQYDFLYKTPIYIVSSSNSSLDIGKFREYPFIKDYIIKPIDRDGVYDLIKKYEDNILL